MCVYVILNMNISINTVGTSTKELKRKLELAMKKLPSRLQLHILKDPSLISNEFKSQARMLYNAAKNETTTHLRSSRSSKNTSIITYSYHFQPYLKPNHFPYGNFSSAAGYDRDSPTVPLARPKASSKASRLPSARCSSCKR